MTFDGSTELFDFLPNHGLKANDTFLSEKWIESFASLPMKIVCDCATHGQRDFQSPCLETILLPVTRRRRVNLVQESNIVDMHFPWSHSYDRT